MIDTGRKPSNAETIPEKPTLFFPGAPIVKRKDNEMINGSTMNNKKLTL